MTVKIQLSQAKQLGNFKKLVDDFATEVHNWKKQERMVAQTKDESDPLKRYASYPQPSAHLLVMSAINEQGRPDFEIVDDSEERNMERFKKHKKLLFDVIHNTERDMQARIFPYGKRRLAQLKRQEIEEKSEEDRTEEDLAFLASAKETDLALKKLDRWVAETLSEIEDLTIDDIDAWEPKLFNT